MKKQNSLFFTLLIIFSFIYSINSIAQVQWPVPPFNQQHIIAGTIGEYRNTNRFHLGVDINGGTNVYAINSGNAHLVYDGDNSYILIGSVLYIHLNFLVSENDPISIGQLIGTMKSTHVHLQDNNRNFLAGNLYPYTDAISPSINGYSFRLNGHTLTNPTPEYSQKVNINNIDYFLLYNKVDIVVDASDPSGNQTLAPYSLTYEIFDFNGLSIDGNAIDNITFELIPNNNAALYTFGYGTTFSPPVYKYVLTSHPRNTPYDRYWNTSLRRGLSDSPDWPINNTRDARNNEEAHYSDGLYSIEFVAYDVDYANIPHNHDREVANVLIDNFRPYISKVEIWKNNKADKIYSREWTWNGSSLEIGAAPPDPKICNADEDIWIKVFTSERTTQVTLDLKKDNINTSFINTINATAGEENKVWEFYVKYDVLPKGNYTLNISGNDYAGNSLQKDPSQIPVRQANGTWLPTPISGTDTYHSFELNEIIPVKAEFSAIPTSCLKGGDVSFTNNSTGDPTEWFWVFGDKTTSREKEPTHTFNIPGVYNVTLTVSKGDNNVNTETKYSYIHVGQTLNAKFSCPSSAATGQTISFIDQSTGGFQPYSYSWDISSTTGFSYSNGTNDESPNPKIIFDDEDTYTITLKVTDNIGNTNYYSQNITINQGLTVNFYPTFNTNIVNEQVPFISYVSGGVGPYSYSWNFGDAGSGNANTSTHQYPSHSFSIAGTYTVSLAVTDNIGNIKGITKDVIIQPQSGPYGSFEASPTYGNAPLEVTFTILSVGNASGIQWFYGDGISSGVITPVGGVFPDNIHTYQQKGSYTVQLKVYGFESDNNIYTRENYINVGASTPPIPLSIDYLYVSSNCYSTDDPPTVGVLIRGGTPFYDNINQRYYYLFSWTPNDAVMPPRSWSAGNIVNFGSNPTFPVTKTFNVTVQDGTFNYVNGSLTVTFYDGRINVNQGNDITICPGKSYMLKPTISGGTPPYTYLWNFGNKIDLNEANIAAPIVTPSVEGTNNYLLQVTDANGCINNLDESTVKVTAANLKVDAGKDETICFGQSKNMNLNVTGGLITGSNDSKSYAWTPTNGISCSNCKNPVITPSSEGAVTYTVNVTDATGCTDDDNLIVTSRYSQPVVDLGHDIKTCADEIVNLKAAISGGDGPFSYKWSVDNEIKESIKESITVGPLADKYTDYTVTCTVTVTDKNTNCVATDEVNVTFNSMLEYGWVKNSIITCFKRGTPIHLEDFCKVTGGTHSYSYSWTPKEEIDNSTIYNPIARPTHTTVFKLYATDANGCHILSRGYDYLDAYIGVFEDIPKADFQITSEKCESKEICFKNTSNIFFEDISEDGSCGGEGFNVSFEWNFGSDAIPNTITNINDGYANCYSRYIPNVCTSYKTSGDKTISLTAYTPMGSNTVTKTIFVNKTSYNVENIKNLCGDINNPDPYKAVYIDAPGAGCSATTINENNTGHLIGKKIVMGHGFHAKRNSHFHAETGCVSTEPPPKKKSKGGDTYNSIVEDSLMYNDLISVSIRPNPNNGKFHILLSGNKDNDLVSLEISNVLGSILFKEENVKGDNFDIDISKETKGFYFIKIYVNDKIFVGKIVYN